MSCASIRRSGFVFAGVACLLSTAAVAFAQPKKDGVDDVQGARWSYDITKPRKGKAESGTFRVFKKVIYHNNKKVGVVHAESATETKLEINGMPELNGTATLTKTGKTPPVWTGQLIRKDGEHWKMKVVMKDR